MFQSKWIRPILPDSTSFGQGSSLLKISYWLLTYSHGCERLWENLTKKSSQLFFSSKLLRRQVKFAKPPDKLLHQKPVVRVITQQSTKLTTINDRLHVGLRLRFLQPALSTLFYTDGSIVNTTYRWLNFMLPTEPFGESFLPPRLTHFPFLFLYFPRFS